MIGRLGIWRHLVVLLVIVICSVLALLGVIGGRGESFDSKQITVSPAGGEGISIREVVDQDFGNSNRHGYERNIPNDFGVPVNVSASSPTANADVGVSSPNFGETRIRLGDPDQEFTGQHRYILDYTLPNGQLSTGVLNLDIIGTEEELETARFEVVITGFVLQDPMCNVGGDGDRGGCSLEQVGDDYRVVFTPLAAGDGVTIGGRIVAYTEPVIPDLPALPASAPDRRVVLALVMIPLGLLGAGVVFLIARRRGRNEVFSGGAVEAAYGALPPPSAGGTAPSVSTTLVPDSKMAEMTTIEFVPPKGLDPWQGAVLLEERIDDGTVAAWFSALAAAGAITLRDDDGDLVIGSGPRRGELDPSNGAMVDQFMGSRSEIKLGSYDPQFAAAWNAVRVQQGSVIAASGWWRRGAPGSSQASAGFLFRMLILAFVFVFVVGGGVVTAGALGLLQSLPAALLIGLLAPVITAVVVYSTMLASRSATGSALALLTESFRKFLEASEGRHVDWAWSQGLLREYSAWAVALGAADAWGKALSSSGVPASEYAMSNPLLVHSMHSSFASSHTAPSSSGSGGSSGGGVGGGGGGGSSGSW